MDELRIQSVNEHTQTQAREVILQGLKEHFGFLDTSLNPDLNDIMQSYVKQENIFLVGLLRDEVVCCGALRTVNDNTGRIVRMSVKQAYRRNGYASRMIDALEEIASARGYTKIMLKTMHHWSDAVGFYISRGYTEDELEGHSIRMIKSLS
ncbi:GNAT family N-acetyltransferase [Paenibacillus lycopersici]|uniref:GNAT family N-acetyltransferase n=2 Tax=Paenibacillus lycopersici TaxID=2704462 RepID=A0A6C0G8Q3_9BACL|nr:GNAT family N-acetyltransferase [Paenibacillus lycopersici]